MKKAVRCDCGKILAFKDGEEILIKCKKCKREIDLVKQSKKKRAENLKGQSL